MNPFYQEQVFNRGFYVQPITKLGRGFRLQAMTPPGKEAVGYHIKVKNFEGKTHEGRIHKFRPSDHHHYVMWDRGDGHWLDLSKAEWGWVGKAPSAKPPYTPPVQPDPKSKPDPKPSADPRRGNLKRLGKPGLLEMNHATTRLDSAWIKRAKGNKSKAEQYIDNRTKATTSADKLNAWHSVLTAEGFTNSARKAAQKLAEMGLRPHAEG